MISQRHLGLSIALSKYLDDQIESFAQDEYPPTLEDVEVMVQRDFNAQDVQLDESILSVTGATCYPNGPAKFSPTTQTITLTPTQAHFVASLSRAESADEYLDLQDEYSTDIDTDR